MASIDATAAATAAAIEKYYQRLVSYVRKQDYSKALLVCDKLLKESSVKDQDRLHVTTCNTVLLLLKGDTKKALDSTTNDSNVYLKAYALYILKRNEESLNLVLNATTTGLTNNDNNILLVHIKAQLLYRLEKYQESFTLYKSIILHNQVKNGKKLSEQQDDDDDDKADESITLSELQTNAIASLAALTAFSDKISLELQTFLENTMKEYPPIFDKINHENKIDNNDEDDNYWELKFNVATALLNLNRFGEAQVYLESLYKNNPKNKKILAQYAYSKQIKGDLNEAEKLYLEILSEQSKDEKEKEEPLSMDVQVLATNNLVALRGHRDLFDGHKRFKTIFDETTTATSTTSKTSTNLKYFKGETTTKILQNRALLFAFMQRSKEYTQAITEILTNKQSTNGFGIITKAAMSLQSKKGDDSECIEILIQGLKENPEFIDIRLSLAQLYIGKKDYKTSLQLLNEIPNESIRNSPAVVGVCIGLMEKLGDNNGSKSLFDKYKTNPSIQLGNARELMKNEKWKEAFAILQNLVSNANQDIKSKALAYLSIVAVKTEDLQACEKYSSMLPKPFGVDQISKTVDDLEGFDLSFNSSSSSSTTTTGTIKALNNKKKNNNDANTAKAKEKLRKEKARKKYKLRRRAKYLKKLQEVRGIIDLQAHFNSIDPERWIPMSRRKNAPKKQKRRQGAIKGGGAAQGAAVMNTDLVDKLDVAKQKATAAAESSKMNTSTASSSGNKKKR